MNAGLGVNVSLGQQSQLQLPPVHYEYGMAYTGLSPAPMMAEGNTTPSSKPSSSSSLSTFTTHTHHSTSRGLVLLYYTRACARADIQTRRWTIWLIRSMLLNRSINHIITTPCPCLWPLTRTIHLSLHYRRSSRQRPLSSTSSRAQRPGTRVHCTPSPDNRRWPHSPRSTTPIFHRPSSTRSRISVPQARWDE